MHYMMPGSPHLVTIHVCSGTRRHLMLWLMGVCLVTNFPHFDCTVQSSTWDQWTLPAVSLAFSFLASHYQFVFSCFNISHLLFLSADITIDLRVHSSLSVNVSVSTCVSFYKVRLLNSTFLWISVKWSDIKNKHVYPDDLNHFILKVNLKATTWNTVKVCAQNCQIQHISSSVQYSTSNLSQKWVYKP